MTGVGVYKQGLASLYNRLQSKNLIGSDYLVEHEKKSSHLFYGNSHTPVILRHRNEHVVIVRQILRHRIM